LNDLVRSRQQRFREGEAKSIRRFEIDDKLNFCSLLNWKWTATQVIRVRQRLK
jgi:hypothetical protein